jgi:hypothetical protein
MIWKFVFSPMPWKFSARPWEELLHHKKYPWPASCKCALCLDVVLTCNETAAAYATLRMNALYTSISRLGNTRFEVNTQKDILMLDESQYTEYNENPEIYPNVRSIGVCAGSAKTSKSHMSHLYRTVITLCLSYSSLQTLWILPCNRWNGVESTNVTFTCLAGWYGNSRRSPGNAFHSVVWDECICFVECFKKEWTEQCDFYECATRSCPDIRVAKME